MAQISKYLFGDSKVTIKQVVQADRNNNISVLASVTSNELSKANKEFILNNINKANVSNSVGEIDYNKAEAVKYALNYTNDSGLDKFIYSLIGGGDAYYVYDYLTSNMNPNYYSYEENCANFVSQVLYEGGGIQMNDNWYMYRDNNIQTAIASAYDNYRGLVSASSPVGLLLPNQIPIVNSALSKLTENSYHTTETWGTAAGQYEYFSDIGNGYTSMESIVINNTNDYQNALSTGIIEPGDLMYFANKGVEEPHHATIITSVDDEGIYYSGKSVERHNEYLNPEYSFDDQYVKIIHMNGR